MPVRRFYDVSVPIHPDIHVYEGDPPAAISRIASLAAGDQANVTRLDLGAHTGTHVDAPLHFIDGGAGVADLALDALVGPAQVVDATRLDAHIDAAALAALPLDTAVERLIFKTKNSQLWSGAAFARDFIALTEDAATVLVERGVRLVGIDYLSIAPYADPAPTHLALLGAGVIILEGLDLRDVPPGMYELICLPLRIVDSDGAPARAVLRDLR